MTKVSGNGRNDSRGTDDKIFLPSSTMRSGAKEKTGEYQSGQMGQTVNLLVYTFGGSNPSSPTSLILCYKHREILAIGSQALTSDVCGSSSVDRASAFQAEGREFEPRLPL